MANVTVDSTELEYLKSCRDKLRDIVASISEEKTPPEEKLKEIEKIIKSWPSIRKDEVN